MLLTQVILGIIKHRLLVLRAKGALTKGRFALLTDIERCGLLIRFRVVCLRRSQLVGNQIKQPIAFKREEDKDNV